MSVRAPPLPTLLLASPIWPDLSHLPYRDRQTLPVLSPLCALSTQLSLSRKADSPFSLSPVTVTVHDSVLVIPFLLIQYALWPPFLYFFIFSDFFEDACGDFTVTAIPSSSHVKSRSSRFPPRIYHNTKTAFSFIVLLGVKQFRQGAKPHVSTGASTSEVEVASHQKRGERYRRETDCRPQPLFPTTCIFTSTLAHMRFR